MADRRIRGVPEGGLEQMLHAHALTQLRRLSPDDVLAELREEGITSLEELVQATLASVQVERGPGDVANEFIYKQFIYKDTMPAPDEVIRALRRPES